MGATVTIIQDLRNRAAHHEPLIIGFPLTGRKDKRGNLLRLTGQQGHDACLLLSRMIDRDLGAWLAGNSTVPALLAKRRTPAAPPTAADGPEALADLPYALVEGRALTWYGPSLLSARRTIASAAGATSQ